MKSTSEIAHLHALDFLYEHQSELPYWLRGLSYDQLVDIAKLMMAFHSASGGERIVPIEEVEQREIIRTIALCGGDVKKAAKALKMGKTTIYAKLRRWGVSGENRRAIHQASTLAEGPKSSRSAVSSL
jgi:DNA-binding NtrC family response regulator